MRFDRLRTPREDGEVLIEPAGPEWAGMIERNVRSRLENSCDLRLAGIGVEEVRHATRNRLFGPDLVQPIIACGHQPEFAHPGVWAKHVVVHDVVSQLGLHGADLVVDNDAPRSTALVLPQVDDEGYVSKHAIPLLAGTTGAAYESRPPLAPTAIDVIQRQSAGTLAGVTIPGDGRLSDNTLVFQYLRGMALVERPRDFVEQHLAGRSRIDRTFSADLQEIRVSEAFDGPFVADILLSLERFAREYNASLAQYRREQQVRSPDRPLPDLKHAGDRVEAPFWIYQPLQQRRRLWIADRKDRLDIYAGEELAGTLSRADLARNAPCALASLAPWLIRPRALTLTLWARLLVCDLFVHGIGGAKYDRINDGIFHRYYGCEPPPYACVSATLRLPLPHFSAGPDLAIEAQRRRRDVTYNPQKHVNGPPADWLAERARLISRSAELRESRGDRIERREVFNAIREMNDRIARLEADLAGRLEGESRQISRQLESNELADSREFFYALQPRARLDMLVSRLREAVRGVPVRT